MSDRTLQSLRVLFHQATVSTQVLFKAQLWVLLPSSSRHLTCTLSMHITRSLNMQTTCTVGSGCHGTIQDELNHIATCAANNNLRLNSNKTSERVVSRRGTKAPLPPLTGSIQRVESLKVLGVYLQSDMKMSTHVSEVLSSSPELVLIVVICPAGPLQPRPAPYSLTRGRARLHAGETYVCGAGLVGVYERGGEG